MPQLDSEPPVSTYSGSNNDRKIACETLANSGGIKPEKTDDEKELPPDFPPESICLSKDAEFDWFDRNAFLERKESAKGNTSHSTNVTTPNMNLNSSSQKLSLTLNTKSSFFGFPKSLKCSSVDTKRKTCKPANIRLFPTKRSESALKAVSAPEPVSPKVSCMGRVRSKKGRRRSGQNGEKSVLERSKSSGGKRKTGFYAQVISIFRFGYSQKKLVQSGMDLKINDSIPEEPVAPRKSTAERLRNVPESGEPVGLGGMMRFKSGRRSGSWAAEEINLVVAEAFGSDREVGPNKRN